MESCLKWNIYPVHCDSVLPGFTICRKKIQKLKGCKIDTYAHPHTYTNICEYVCERERISLFRKERTQYTVISENNKIIYTNM